MATSKNVKRLVRATMAERGGTYNGTLMQLAKEGKVEHVDTPEGKEWRVVKGVVVPRKSHTQQEVADGDGDE